MSMQKAQTLCNRRSDACHIDLVEHGYFVSVLNDKLPPFDDPKMREVARYAFDVYKSIALPFQGLVGGPGRWMHMFYPEASLTPEELYALSPWVDPSQRTPVDIWKQKAMDRLTELGFPNGLDLEYPYYVNTSTPLLRDMDSVMLIDITAAGFRVDSASTTGVPIWPLHSWLPDAHTDAPTAASVMLAGVLLKMGAYGMLRISATMFPEVMAGIAWLLASVGVINILYGAAIVLRQTDLKRLIAFSSISHMGFVVLGLSAVVGVNGQVSTVGITGAALQMFTHGTITGLLFLLAGFIYERTHTRHIPHLGGLATRMPMLTGALVLAGLASLGLPSTSGFVSEIHVFLGVFPVWSWLTAVGAFGVVLTAGYILWMIQRAMFGPENQHLNNVSDATVMEMVPVAVMVAAIMVVGIYPAIIADVFTTGIQPIVDSLQIAVTASLQ